MKVKDEAIKAYALKNAIEHKGKAVVGAVVNSLFNEGLKKNKIKDIMPRVLEIVNEVNFYKLEEQKKQFLEFEDMIGHRVEREGLRELPDVKKSGVVMRTAPSASGPLHIGHAITFSLSYLYVKKYGGKFYIRIEDTNPKTIYKPAYKMIEKESKWLFENNCEIVIQSNRMDLYYSYAEKLIKKSFAYVCTCSQEDFKDYVYKKKACPCSKLDVKEQMNRWKKMLDKKGYKEGEAVLRFKSGMTLKNPAMRDFPLARISEVSHPLQGKKYRAWPLMNLAVSVDDIEMKMTHIIRGKDHRDNAKKQKMIFDVLGKKFPWTGFLGIIHFEDLELSTSKMREAIENKKYSGWDDKRLPTVASLKKQGYKPSAFHKLAEQIGLNEVDKKMSKREFFLLLDNFNRVV